MNIECGRTRNNIITTKTVNGRYRTVIEIILDELGTLIILLGCDDTTDIPTENITTMRKGISTEILIKHRCGIMNAIHTRNQTTETMPMNIRRTSPRRIIKCCIHKRGSNTTTHSTQTRNRITIKDIFGMILPVNSFTLRHQSIEALIRTIITLIINLGTAVEQHRHNPHS